LVVGANAADYEDLEAKGKAILDNITIEAPSNDANAKK